MQVRKLLPLVFLVGCNPHGFEAEIQGRAPFAAPEVYLDWWQETLTCSAEPGAFEDLVFYLADWITGDGRVARARWSAPHDIVIVRGYETHSKTVRHEMLHDLLRGDPDHADARWQTCGLVFG